MSLIETGQDNQYLNNKIENVAQALEDLPLTDKLSINNLRKKYATGKVAVEDLSITMYKN